MDGGCNGGSGRGECIIVFCWHCWQGRNGFGYGDRMYDAACSLLAGGSITPSQRNVGWRGFAIGRGSHLGVSCSGGLALALAVVFWFCFSNSRFYTGLVGWLLRRGISVWTGLGVSLVHIPACDSLLFFLFSFPLPIDSGIEVLFFV